MELWSLTLEPLSYPGAVEAHSGALKYNRAIFIFSSNTGGMSIKGYLLFGG
jgi:hypothetical protein